MRSSTCLSVRGFILYMIQYAMKEGKVLLVGRPNTGKSTFINNLIGQKVSITSPKPQTTRFPIKALFQDERGKIIFIDTPGIFGKTQDFLSKNINEKTIQAINEEADVVIYMIDHTRRRDFEEAKVLGIVRKLDKPKILVINKIDQLETYLPQYEYLRKEFKRVFKISALQRLHIKPLLNEIYELLPAKEKSEIGEESIYPLLNIDSKIFISELIREKIFLMMGEEIPYTTTVLVDQIKGRRKIKEIGSYARKEIALATSKKIYLNLTVEVDPHWQETYYS